MLFLLKYEGQVIVEKGSGFLTVLAWEMFVFVSTWRGGEKKPWKWGTEGLASFVIGTTNKEIMVTKKLKMY